jgi:molybdopterin-guanine dinucleotide biosynthesis protein A
MAIANDIAPYLDSGAMLIQDIVAQQGPLGGIYTALLFSPCEWVFVKATDMPLLIPQMASLVVEAARGDFDAVVPKAGEFFEPLLAVYNRRCLPAIERQLKETENRQIVSLLKKIKLRTIAQKEWQKVDPGGLSFKNINTASDLAQIDGT